MTGNHPDQASSWLKQAVPQVEKESEDPDAANAHTVLVRSSLMEGGLAEARRAYQRAGRHGGRPGGEIVGRHSKCPL
jgi:hypothetical protein